MRTYDSGDYTGSTNFILLLIDTYQMLMGEEYLDEEQKDLLERLTVFIEYVGLAFNSRFDGSVFSNESHAVYYKLCEAAEGGDEDARGKLEILRPYFRKAMSNKLKERRN